MAAWHADHMLLKLTGSSCSGKSTLAFAVADRLQAVAVHDFDEVGVPEGADRQWRQRTTELWVRRALEYQRRGIDLLLTGQSPLGEVLAAPSAPLLDGIAVCLVDVADEARRVRLAERDGDRWDARAIDAFIGWAAWHRDHARDPHHRPEVIIGGGGPGGLGGPGGPGGLGGPDMVWHRWSGWSAEDPRWCTHLLDTSGEDVARSVDRLERWVAEQREAHRGGWLALGRGWWDGGEEAYGAEGRYGAEEGYGAEGREV